MINSHRPTQNVAYRSTYKLLKMADGENPIQHLEDEPGQGQGIKQFMELINNNAQVPQQRPDILQWRLQRAKTIRTLNELRKKLDLACVGANYGKCVGSGAQISGAVTTIIGAIMALGKSPSAATLMNVGNLINNVGALVGGVSNIVESYVSAEYLREVKVILDKDKELSQPLREWLAFSRGLEENLEIIIGSDLKSAIQKNVLKVFSEFTVLYTSTRGFLATLEIMNKGQYAMHIGTDVTVGKLRKFSKELDMSPKLGDTIVKLSESLNLLQVAKDGVEAYKNLLGDSASSDKSSLATQSSVASINPGVTTTHNDESLELASNSHEPLHSESASVKAVSAFCAFRTIDIAAGVVSLLSALMVISEDKSKFSDALKQISDLLEDELRSMEELDL